MSNTAPPLPVLGQIESRWSPPEAGNILTHAGAAVAPDLVFIGAPPPEIGDIVSAHSTIREKGANSWFWHRMGWGLSIGWLSFAVLAYLTNRLLGVSYSSLFSTPLGIIFALVGAIPGYLYFAPANATTFVGTHGAARFLWGGKNRPVKSAQIVPFAQVNASNVRMTRHYYNGIYTGTDYTFVWGQKDIAATSKIQNLLTVSGRFYRAKGPRKNDEIYHFGSAVEQAYTAYRMVQLKEILAQGGSEPFQVGASGQLVLSAAGLQVALGGKQEFIPRENIVGLDIDNGIITITRAGYKKGVLGIGSEGVFKVGYAQIASPRLFLSLLAYVVNLQVPIEDEAKASA